MDQDNYVVPNPNGDGTFIVVVGGQPKGSYTQDQAEQMFNYLQGGPPLYESGGVYDPGTGGGNEPAGYRRNPQTGQLEYVGFGNTTTTGNRPPSSSPYNAANYEYMPAWLKQLDLQAANDAAEQAFKERYLQLIQIPMLENDRRRIAQAAAADAAGKVLQAHLGSGQLGTAAYQGAGQLAVSAGNLGMQAAQLGSSEALQALNIAAGLRGPRSAFQQQAAMHGLNEQGLSNAVGAIAGKYDLAGFKAPQAAPEAASLRTMAEDFQGAGRYGTRMAPSDYARLIAEQTRQQVGGYGQGMIDVAGRSGQGMIDVANEYYGNYGQGYGLNPGATSGGTPTGQYNTGSGVRNIEQMRQELKAANYPNWEKAGEQEIVETYKRTTGKDVTPITTGGAGPAGGTLSGTNQTMQQWYRDYSTRNGRPPNQQEWVQQLSFETGLSPQKAAAAYEMSRQWQARTGRANMTDAEWGQFLGQIQRSAPGTTTQPADLGMGGLPTDQNYDQLKRQARWPGQGTYQPGQFTDTDRAYNDAYSAAQMAQTGNSDDMFRRAPPGWQPGMPTLYGQYDRGRVQLQQGQSQGQGYQQPWQNVTQTRGYQPRETTDVDRAYNDAYAAAEQAQKGYTNDIFRFAPQGWRPGMPVNVGQGPTPSGAATGSGGFASAAEPYRGTRDYTLPQLQAQVSRQGGWQGLERPTSAQGQAAPQQNRAMPLAGGGGGFARGQAPSTWPQGQTAATPTQATPGFRAPYSTDIEAYKRALPAANKIAPRAWLRLDQDSRDFLMSGFEARGDSANYIEDQIRRSLPQFRAPRVGMVA